MRRTISPKHTCLVFGEHYIFNRLVLSAGTGYTHSSLDWYENNGNACIQSVYLSPSMGYVGEYGYAGLVLLGSRSFYEVNRKIHFSNFKDTAHNNHKSYDLLAGCRGSLRLKFPENFQKNLFLLPTVNLDYLNIFESGYQESGAGALNLSVKNVHSAFLRPEVKFKLLKELNTRSVCSQGLFRSKQILRIFNKSYWSLIKKAFLAQFF